MRTWVNGTLLDAEQARVSAFDHGLTVGDGVFETVKVVDGVPFALRRHLDRLARSAAGLGLPAPDLTEVRAACLAVVAQAPVGLYRLRITYTGGVAPLGSERGDTGPTLVVAMAPTVPPSESTAAAVVPWTRNERGALAGLKTTSYAENVVALARARRLGATEAVFADTQGRLSEGTGSNIFVVVDGRVLTPALSSGCLDGITRQLILEWTDAEEVALPMSVLDSAAEVFLTSSIRDVQAVDAIVGDTATRNLGPPGPITREAASTFAKRSLEDPEP
ncbi:MAG TPA: aminotransferase class IV [Jiangellaceae bacterium]|nr:aminotransferase class IV [Jiangellaceae bacterium]